MAHGTKEKIPPSSVHSGSPATWTHNKGVTGSEQYPPYGTLLEIFNECLMVANSTEPRLLRRRASLSMPILSFKSATRTEINPAKSGCALPEFVAASVWRASISMGDILIAGCRLHACKSRRAARTSPFPWNDNSPDGETRART